MKIACRVWLAAAVMAAACSQERITSSGGTGGPPAVASKLAFTVPPGNTTAGVAFKPAVAVAIEDSSGHVITNAINAVTVKIDTGLSGLSGTTTVKAVNGVATFPDLSIQQAGDAYFLTASSGNLTRATSASFAVTPAAPARLSFITQASTTSETRSITPAIEVAIADAFGNAITSATNAVTLAIGRNPGGGTLTGTTTVNAVNGVATFSNLSIDKPSAGYTLVATAAGLTSVETSPFMITGTPALIIKVAGDGQAGVEGCPLPAPLVVQVNDRNNQPVAGIRVDGGFGVTDSNGRAQAMWVLPRFVLQLQTTNASVANVGSVTFVAWATLPPGCVITGKCPPGTKPCASSASRGVGLDPASVSFTASRGGADPGPQTVSVGGTWSGLSVGTLKYLTDSSGQTMGWLSATLSGNTAPTTLTLSATTGTLAPGTYTAYVPVANWTAFNYVAVTFTVR